MTANRSTPAGLDRDTDLDMDMDLYDQPGHLLRRAHQIAQAVYYDTVGKDVTPIQYAIMRMVHQNPGVDQGTLAGMVALDTSTAASTAVRLEAKGLLTRDVGSDDRRQRLLSLTPKGEQLLRELVNDVRHLRELLLGSLDPQEQVLFMQMLRRFVHLNNEQSRAPLRTTTRLNEASVEASR